MKSQLFTGKLTGLITIIYLFSVVFWLAFTFTDKFNSSAGLYFQTFLFIIPFLGSIVGFINSKYWGGFGSAMGKATFFLSLGLFTWSLGMLAWNYYIFFTTFEIPYPSLADVAFILSWPLWTIGIFNLSKATGATFAIKKAGGKLMFVLIPLATIALSYYLVITIARGGVIDLDTTSKLKLFFDLFYPIGTTIIITVILTFFGLSYTFLGGKYKKVIVLLVIGFIFNYFSDITFSYTTTQETYFNGHFADMLFVTTMYLLSLTMFKLNPFALGDKMANINTEADMIK